MDIGRGPLSSTCGLMMTARIASPCVPRPRFELGFSSARSTGLRQTRSTVMLHQVAGSPIIRHDVFDVGPSTPYFSLPMIIVLGDNDDSVTDSIAASIADILLSNPVYFVLSLRDVQVLRVVLFSTTECVHAARGRTCSSTHCRKKSRTTRAPQQERLSR